MSMSSAVQALSQDTPKIDSLSPTSPSQGSIEGSPAPKTLESVIKPSEPVKPVPGADRFAALAKKERQIQKQLSEVKMREAKAKEWESLKASAASNPLKALEVLGISYEQLTNFILNGQKPTPDLEMKSVKDELAAIKQAQVDRDRQTQASAKERAEREYKQTLGDFQAEVVDYLGANKDNYELTNMYEGLPIVMATIEQHFANTKKIMSIKEASDLVEQYFEEQVKKANASKKFSGSQAQKKDGQPMKEGAAKNSAPTLTNGMTSSAPSLLPAKTENDRIQRALAVLSK